MTKNGVESENEFDVDEPDEVKPETKSNSRRQSSRVRVSRVPVVMDTGSSDENLSGEDSDFEELIPKKRMRVAGGGGRSGRRKPPSKVVRVSSTTNGQADNEAAGSEDNSNAAASDSDPEPTSTTIHPPSLANQTPNFQSGGFVVSKKDFKKLTDPPIWRIDGKALLQKFVPFQRDGKTCYKNTSVYSGWSNSTKKKYYACSVLYKQQNKKEHIIEFLKDKIVPDENYVCSESEAEGDNNDGGKEKAGGKKKVNKSDDDDDEEEEEEEEDDDEDDDDEGDNEDEDDNNGEEEEEEGEDEDKEDDEKGASKDPKE